MSVLPGLAVLLLGSAALLGALALASGRGAFGRLPRALAGGGALALLPSAGETVARPLMAFAVGAALLAPRPLSWLLASAAALRLYLRGASGLEGAPWALLFVGLAAAAAAAAVSSSSEARLAGGRDGARAAAWGGAAVSLLLASLDGGSVLRWGYTLGEASTRLELPGAGLLLGLALLTSLAGTLLLGSHLITQAPGVAAVAGVASAEPPMPFPALAGRRLLVLGAGLSTLGAGFVLAKGLAQREDALAAGATEVAGLLLATGLLVLGLVFLLGGPPASDAARAEARAGIETRGAAALALLAAGLAGLEGWIRGGTYATPLASATGAAALLGLAAVQPTRLALLRRAAFLGSLVFLLV